MTRTAQDFRDEATAAHQRAAWAIASTYYSGDEEKQALGRARYATMVEADDAADRLSHQHPNAEFDVVQVKDGGTNQ